MEYGIYSILPIVVCFSLIFAFKNPFIAILSGIITSLIIIFISTGEFIGFSVFIGLVSNFSTMKTILFILLVGAIIQATEKSLGVEGLIVFLKKKKIKTDSKIVAQLFAMLIGCLLFVDAMSSLAITAVVGKPLFKSAKLPKEKLALIANSTASPVAWLIPFGGAGALVAGILSGIDGTSENSFNYVLQAMPFQFYTISLFTILLISVLFSFEIGPIKKMSTSYEIDNSSNEKTLDENAKAINMILPIFVLVGVIFTLMFITGDGDILSGDGAFSVFYSGLITLVFILVFYSVNKTASIAKTLTWFLEGSMKMASITFLLFIAFLLSEFIAILGTAPYLLSLFSFVDISYLPLTMLILAGVISFSTGTSGGTVAIVTPLAIPMAVLGAGNIPLTLGAIISGAVFGDQNSIISDSVIFTSSVTEVDTITHVKTQLPYTLIAFGISCVLYLVLAVV